MREAPKPQEVHVWTVCIEDTRDAHLIERWRNVLDADERAQMDRFVTAELRHLYLVSHALVRIMLSHFANAAPREWVFERNRQGAPRIAQPCEFRRLSFNLSHTRGWAACGVALDRELGVDLEHIPEFHDYMKIAARYFSPGEIEQLEAATPECRPHVFARLWTLKEAYIKARGMGLSIPLDSFSMEAVKLSPRIHFRDTNISLPEEWVFWMNEVDGCCHQAVAARRVLSDTPVLKARRCVPDWK